MARARRRQIARLAEHRGSGLGPGRKEAQNTPSAKRNAPAAQFRQLTWLLLLLLLLLAQVEPRLDFKGHTPHGLVAQRPRRRGQLEAGRHPRLHAAAAQGSNEEQWGGGVERDRGQGPRGGRPGSEAAPPARMLGLRFAL